MDDKFIVTPRKPAFGKSSVVSARLPNELIQRLDKVVLETDRTRNEVIVMAIEYALNHLEIVKD